MRGNGRFDFASVPVPLSCYFNTFFTRNQPHKHLYSLREISTPTRQHMRPAHAARGGPRHRWLSGWAHWGAVRQAMPTGG